jgi:hypothetical protein
MDAKQFLERLEHRANYLWLNYRLAEEMPFEYIRRAIAKSKLPPTSFTVDDKLKRLLKLR